MSERPLPLTAGVADSQTLAESDTQRLMAQSDEACPAQLVVRDRAQQHGARPFDVRRRASRLIVCNAIYREIYELPEELTQPGTHIAQLVAYHALKEGGRQLARRAGAAAPLDRVARRRAQRAARPSRTRSTSRTDASFSSPTSRSRTAAGSTSRKTSPTRRRLPERISWLAHHCSLTETANRFHLRELLERGNPEGLKGDNRLAVHLIDLDRFKQVNDTLGHAAGDALLKAVAKRMRSTVRDNDLRRTARRRRVRRRPAGRTRMTPRSRRWRSASESAQLRPIRVLGNTANVGASIGVVMAPKHGTETPTACCAEGRHRPLPRQVRRPRLLRFLSAGSTRRLRNERVQLESDMRYARSSRTARAALSADRQSRTREVDGLRGADALAASEARPHRAR